jgi:hypothetical protein
LQEQIRRRGELRLRVHPEFEQIGDDTIISSTEMPGGRDDDAQERFQVIKFRDGKIVDLQGCASRRAAERFARRRSARQV